MSEALRMADLLQRMYEFKTPHPGGPTGQMCGMEQYRLVASGFTFAELQDAADELRRLSAQVEKLEADRAALLAALKEALQALEFMDENFAGCETRLANVRAAIANVEGKQ